MQIKLDNVGIVRNSSIDIEGLTVITGANNSGKSTVGKAAYALVHAVENYEFEALFDRYSYAISHLKDIPSLFPVAVKSAFKSMASSLEKMELRAVFSDQKMLKDIEMTEIDSFLGAFRAALLQTEFDDLKVNGGLFFNLLNDNRYSSDDFESDKIKALTSVDAIVSKINDDPDLKKYIREAAKTQLEIEFSGQIAPAKEPSSRVLIDIRSGVQPCIHVELQNGEYPDNVRNVLERKPYSKVVYIDDPFVVEDEYQFSRQAQSSRRSGSFINSGVILRHRDDLRLKLKNLQELNVWEKVQATEKFKLISDRMNAVLPGTFISENNSKFYKGADGAKLDISNLATGAKMFSILKMLITSGDVSERSLLILDEPECHLHPDWQNKFAEIVVLLVKEIGCHVLLTTHSQNFVLALDTMTRAHKIKNRTRFYQAEKDPEGFVLYRDMTNSISKVYESMLKSFSEMKDIYDSLMEREDA